jgi:hypothetical protein
MKPKRQPASPDSSNPNATTLLIMTTQELIFHYWQDAQDAWHWQLISHEQPAVGVESTADRPGNACHRIVAAGVPLPTEEQTLAEIELIKGSSGASTLKAPPRAFPPSPNARNGARFQAS